MRDAGRADERLPLSNVDLDELVTALEHDGEWAEWYLDPAIGRTVLSADAAYAGFEDEVDTDDMIAIGPRSSRDAYEAMVAFADAVADPRARPALQRALDGKGAFRRFRRALDDLDDLGLQWRDFELVTSEIRALRWLLDHDVVRPDEAEAAIAERMRRADAVLAAIGDDRIPRFDAAVVTDRWDDLVGRIDEGGIVLTRDGQDWCTITPVRPNADD